MNKKAVSIRGKAVNIGSEKLKEVFEQNPYMAEIYPQEESRTALEVFQVAEGTGEFFDLSVKPIYRDTFVLGTACESEKKRRWILYHRPMPRMQDLLLKMSAEMYRSVGETAGDTAGALSALRELHGGMSIWSCGENRSMKAVR